MPLDKKRRASTTAASGPADPHEAKQPASPSLQQPLTDDTAMEEPPTKKGKTEERETSTLPPALPPALPPVPPELDVTWDWESVNLGEHAVVQKYLNREVAAVKLPEKVKNDKTYPGLILDGASGVGKTQQAFALLNDGKQKLVYLLLVDKGPETRQVVYQEMIEITLMTGFLDLVEAARTAVIEKATKQGDDPFGVNYLRGIVASKLGLLDDLVNFIAGRILWYDQGQNNLAKVATVPSLSPLQDRTVGDSMKRLAGTVLFLDEVLPPSGDQFEEAVSRLRFVRNLGRALGMRVVMAGTAATAANMISMRGKAANAALEASRGGEAERGWMEIEFLWNRVKLPLLGPATYTEHEERPYLLSLLEEMEEMEEMTYYDDETKILQALADKIVNDKKLYSESKLIWLSGCWLESQPKSPPSPFAIRSADLVRSHFFEPALATSKEGKRKPQPHMGRGTTPRRRITGPLRIALQRYKHEQDIWWVLLSHTLQAGYSPDFTGIESALSHCVQSCLAMEPILAVSLSIKHSFSPGEFCTTFFNLWNETPLQQRGGAMDGVLNELLLFAVLQMACRAVDGHDRTSFPNTCSVADMVERLWDYLSLAQPPSPPSAVVRNVKYLSGYSSGGSKVDQSPTKIQYSYGLKGNEKENSIKKKYEKTMMPWLVPACSRAKLQETIKSTLRGKGSLFSTGSLNIAGLVPGNTGSYLAASAYLWKSDDVSECAPLEWMFEFKGRSKSYSLNDATDALVAKCENFSADKKGKKGKKEKYHAMLIGLTGSMKSECRIWLEDEKLRIVVLVGSRLV